MSRSITVAIEGPGASQALAELLALPGLQGEARPVERGTVYRDGGLLAAIGAIVGIVGGVASAVSSIIAWREKWKAAHDTRRLSIVIEDARGNRLSLDDATPEQITAALQTLTG
jgi:hypothetical protein